MGPRINAAPIVFYRDHFSSANKGLEYVGNNFFNWYYETMHSLKNRFTMGELCMILDVFNGPALDIQFGGRCMINAGIYDSFDMPHPVAQKGVYEEKWSVTKEEMGPKVAALTPFEDVCLSIWISEFWDSEKLNDDGCMEDHCAALIDLVSIPVGCGRITISYFAQVPDHGGGSTVSCQLWAGGDRGDFTAREKDGKLLPETITGLDEFCADFDEPGEVRALIFAELEARVDLCLPIEEIFRRIENPAYSITRGNRWMGKKWGLHIYEEGGGRKVGEYDTLVEMIAAAKG